MLNGELDQADDPELLKDRMNARKITRYIMSHLKRMQLKEELKNRKGSFSAALSVFYSVFSHRRLSSGGTEPYRPGKLGD
ncbi:maltose acetyltransferase domain-containing protein [Bacillus testis]|uniref:maltose acetyltransferase domain-containing protein n=1 Tax=Bacillus testis TaxID=1622072 RepID=UPI00067EA6CB